MMDVGKIRDGLDNMLNDKSPEDIERESLETIRYLDPEEAFWRGAKSAAMSMAVETLRLSESYQKITEVRSERERDAALSAVASVMERMKAQDAQLDHAIRVFAAKRRAPMTGATIDRASLLIGARNSLYQVNEYLHHFCDEIEAGTAGPPEATQKEREVALAVLVNVGIGVGSMWNYASHLLRGLGVPCGESDDSASVEAQAEIKA